MSDLNLKQIYNANPSTTVANNDLFYLAKSPYGLTNDSGIIYSDLIAQIANSYLPILDSSGSKTFALSDGNSIQSVTGPGTLTIPPNSSVAFKAATKIYIYNNGGTITIAPGVGVTITDPDNVNLTNIALNGLGLLIQSNTLDTWRFIPINPTTFGRQIVVTDPAGTGSVSVSGLPSFTQFFIAGGKTSGSAGIYSKLAFSNDRTSSFNFWAGSGYTGSTNYGVLGYTAGGSAITSYQWFPSDGSGATVIHKWGSLSSGAMQLTWGGVLSGMTSVVTTTGTLLSTGASATLTKAVGFGLTTLTWASTTTWDVSSNQVTKLTLAGNTTLTVTNQVAGFTYLIYILQDATGGRTLTLDSATFDTVGGISLSVAANSKSILTCISDGTKLSVVAQGPFA